MGSSGTRCGHYLIIVNEESGRGAAWIVNRETDAGRGGGRGAAWVGNREPESGRGGGEEQNGSGTGRQRLAEEGGEERLRRGEMGREEAGESRGRRQTVRFREQWRGGGKIGKRRWLRVGQGRGEGG